MKKQVIFFYFLSFLEGASVMAAELLGAKMLAPYFGTSLYVWASVLGITLGGLAMGYFSGGILSEKKNTERNLYYVLLASALFLVLMPLMAKAVMIHTAGLSLILSILISSVVFLLPPVFFMGMVSPLIVQCLLDNQADQIHRSGKAAGTVYGISTMGGITATFFLGFYCIPNFGLTKPAIIMGIILGVVPFVKLISAKKFFSLLFPLAAFISFNSSKLPVENSDIKILYSSEGLLGQIIVADYPLYEGGKKADGSQRILFVNRSTQTIVTTKGGEKSFFEYVSLISEKTKTTTPANRHALVLGLGGGSMANELVKNGYEVEAVELDERMPEVAKKYFGLNESVYVHMDDARHFISRQKVEGRRQKYDAIVLDVFIGEVNPNHLFTQEFFAELNPLLADSGNFFINGNGYWAGDIGKGMRSVCKTLVNSGFDVEVVPTGKNEDYRNLEFVSTISKNKIGKATGNEISSVSLEDAIILSDEKPRLELLNEDANKRWREGCMKYFLSGYYSGRDVLLFR